jgi:ectoine hydroxylase-related dioxygenase (phytanoyl-CoA dioxygenase family)
MKAAFAEAANRNAGVTAPPPVVARPEALTPEQARRWIDEGYFVVPGLVSPETCEHVNRSAIERVRAIRGSGAQLGTSVIADGQILIGEANFSERTPPEHPEDHASKVFNLHRHEVFHAVAHDAAINGHISGLLGPDVDCFNSQFIFKNPGAWGQPWHQDSLYFTFDRHPQVGMWLATSEATIENGCLWVAPGSHTEPLHVHVPDRRPEANLGYLEVVDYDFAEAVPVLMEPGDVLFFHSFLLHKSDDNRSAARRTALVYHFGEPGTVQPGVDQPSGTIDWMPTLRAGAAVR